MNDKDFCEVVNRSNSRDEVSIETGLTSAQVAGRASRLRKAGMFVKKFYGTARTPMPTPNEIAARARECRVRHFASRRSEPADIDQRF